jgi:hypothetical protein
MRMAHGKESAPEQAFFRWITRKRRGTYGSSAGRADATRSCRGGAATFGSSVGKIIYIVHESHAMLSLCIGGSP